MATLNGSELHALGVRCGRISYATGPLPSDVKRLSELFRDLWSKIAENNENALDSWAFDTYVRLLFDDRFRERYPLITVRERTFAEAVEFVHKFLGVSEDPEATKDDAAPMKPDFLTELLGMVSGRMAFTTDSGPHGLSPMSVRDGDIVCVLLGCAMPIVLRKVEGIGYEVVGPCFSPGLIDVEALLGHV